MPRAPFGARAENIADGFYSVAADAEGETCAEADAAAKRWARRRRRRRSGARREQRKDFAILHGHVITGVERIERAHVFTGIHGIDA